MADIPEHLKKYCKERPNLENLNRLPDELKRWKCPICHGAGFKTKVCPECGFTDCIPMCPVDHCHCHHTITERLAYCPICGEPMCPTCGSHDVFQVSRVTGYLADVSGWRSSKQAELKDRVRSNITNGEWQIEGDRH